MLPTLLRSIPSTFSRLPFPVPHAQIIRSMSSSSIPLSLASLAPVAETDGEGKGNELKVLLDTITFASVKHATQRRKDPDSTPYINHPIGVAQLLYSAGHTDLPTLQAAILHDTVEDTDTTFDELVRVFGGEVARIVGECTDDKTLPKAARKKAQIESAPHKSAEAQRVKLADKLYNQRDLQRAAPAYWTVERIQEYHIWAKKVTDICAPASPVLARQLDELYRNGWFDRDGRRWKCHPGVPEGPGEEEGKGEK